MLSPPSDSDRCLKILCRVGLPDAVSSHLALTGGALGFKLVFGAEGIRYITCTRVDDSRLGRFAGTTVGHFASPPDCSTGTVGWLSLSRAKGKGKGVLCNGRKGRRYFLGGTTAIEEKRELDEYVEYYQLTYLS